MRPGIPISGVKKAWWAKSAPTPALELEKNRVNGIKSGLKGKKKENSSEIGEKNKEKSLVKKFDQKRKIESSNFKLCVMCG